jgi:hypothetical protein
MASSSGFPPRMSPARLAELWEVRGVSAERLRAEIVSWVYRQSRYRKWHFYNHDEPMTLYEHAQIVQRNWGPAAFPDLPMILHETVTQEVLLDPADVAAFAVFGRHPLPAWYPLWSEPPPAGSGVRGLAWHFAQHFLKGPDAPPRGRGRLTALAALVQPGLKTAGHELSIETIADYLRPSLRAWEAKEPR